LQWFMTGFLLVDIMLATPAEQLKPKLRWDLISLFGWCTLILCEACRTPSRFSCEAHPVIYGLTVPAAFLAYLGVFRGQVVGAFFRNPWISTIGGMCYTIYMYHYFILRNSAHYALPLLNTQIFHWNLLIQIVVSGSIVLSICAVLFLYCERPFMQRDWPQKAWASGRRLYLTVTGQQPR